MKLRAYQADAIAGCLDALRRCRVEARPPRVLGVMPTGTGKTVTFMTMAKQYADAGHRVLVLAHRRELLEQAQRKGLALGIPAAWMAFEQAQRAETSGETRVVLSTVPSMRTRLARFPADFFRLVIHDEAHRVLAETHRALVDHFAEALLLGWTATPNRGDERALGQVFTEVGFDYTLGDALAAGWLVPPDVRTIETSRDLSSIRTRNGELMAGDVGAVLSELELMREEIGQALRHAADKKSIVYCVTRAHMRVAAECAREMAFERNVDLRVMQVDGDTDDGERDRILADFLRAPTGRGCWLLNVEVATEGFDVPDTEAVIVLRPTMSRALYMQMIGRGLRPLDGLVDTSDLAPLATDLCRFDGRQYCVPRLVDVRILWAHADRLPNPPAGWDGFVDGTAVIGFPGRESGLFGTFFELVVGAGGRLFACPADGGFKALQGRTPRRGSDCRAARCLSLPAAGATAWPGWSRCRWQDHAHAHSRRSGNSR